MVALFAGAVLTSSCAQAAQTDVEKIERARYVALCRFYVAIAPIALYDTAPMPGCKIDHVDVVGLDQIRQESALFWQELEKLDPEGLPGFRRTYEIFVSKVPVVTSANLRKMSVAELCEGFQGYQNREDFFAEIARRKVFGPQTMKAIQKGSVFIGMVESALACSLGTPSNVNRTVGSWGVHKQYVYGRSLYVYTQNGKVTSWQD